MVGKVLIIMCPNYKGAGFPYQRPTEYLSNSAFQPPFQSWNHNWGSGRTCSSFFFLHQWFSTKGKGRMLIRTPKEALSVTEQRYSFFYLIPESTVLYSPGTPVSTRNHSHQQSQRPGKVRLKVQHVFTCLTKHFRPPPTLKPRWRELEEHRHMTRG